MIDQLNADKEALTKDNAEMEVGLNLFDLLLAVFFLVLNAWLSFSI